MLRPVSTGTLHWLIACIPRSSGRPHRSTACTSDPPSGSPLCTVVSLQLASELRVVVSYYVAVKEVPCPCGASSYEGSGSCSDGT